MTNKIYMPFDIYAKYVEIISVMANVRYIAGIVDHTNICQMVIEVYHSLIMLTAVTCIYKHLIRIT